MESEYQGTAQNTEQQGELVDQVEQAAQTGNVEAVAPKPKPELSHDTFQVAADMVDRGENTLDRVAKHIADAFELVYHEVRAEIAKLLPDGHPDKPIVKEPEPDVTLDGSITAVAIAAPASMTVEEAKQHLVDNPGRTSALSVDGHVVRE